MREVIGISKLGIPQLISICAVDFVADRRQKANRAHHRLAFFGIENLATQKKLNKQSLKAMRAAPLGGLLLRVGGVVFAVECLVMFCLERFAPDELVWIALAPVVLTVVVTSIINWWIIQPLSERLSQAMTQLNDARKEAERRAQVDPLTGVLNRCAFFTRLEKAIVLARETQTPLSFLMLDIDRFKRINDTQGHLAGDAVIEHVSEAIQATCIVDQAIGRYGGEEFSILLPDTPLADAVQFAERLRQRIAETVVHHNKVSLNVSASIGVAMLGPNNSDAMALVESADQALFEAKRAGRNQVRLATNPKHSAAAIPPYHRLSEASEGYWPAMNSPANPTTA